MSDLRQQLIDAGLIRPRSTTMPDYEPAAGERVLTLDQGSIQHVAPRRPKLAPTAPPPTRVVEPAPAIVGRVDLIRAARIRVRVNGAAMSLRDAWTRDFVSTEAALALLDEHEPQQQEQQPGAGKQ